ncbi:MAG TPA: DUF6519 domain-containing protein [Blastocatellia bacterium]
MPGDYSRKTFRAEKHYSGVLMQQGRVQLDADWNEQVAAELYRAETEATDVIGPCGVPKKGDGFKISVAAGGHDLTISPGRIYADGMLCELEAQTTYTAQPYLPNPDLTISIGSPPASPPTSPPGASRRLNIDKDGVYLLFLDAWKREITALDDPLIREKALGGPDTTTRLQNVWQVKLLRVADTATSPPTSPPGKLTCETDFAELDKFIAASDGKLTAQTKPPDPQKDPCLLPPTAGYTRLENQLYRVEVHNGGARDVATFKWSRDNASVETSIQKIDGSVVTVSDLGKDEVLGFAAGQWVEVVDDESTLKATPHPLVQIDKIDEATRKITMKQPPKPVDMKLHPKLRRWDQTGVDATGDGVKLSLANLIELEGGIEVNFSTGSYRSGDYWLIPARTATGDIEWPPYQVPNTNPTPQPPFGIKHHYCRLALLQVTGGVPSVIEDCREKFPPLTDIAASDVSYDNANCPELAKVKTVQEALDALCHNRENSCSFVAVPGPGWEAVFDKIASAQDACVCFQVGVYPLSKPVVVSTKGHLKISGCGPGTRIIAPTAEAALTFDSCKTVTVRDIYAETGGLESKKIGTKRLGLNGTLTFVDCEAVDVENVSLKCGASATRAGTCITVWNTAPAAARPARIRHCDLSIGHQQDGILLLNVLRAEVEDNTLRVYDKPERLKLPALLQDLQQRANVRMILISGAHLGLPAPPGGKTNVSLNLGNQVIQFKTHNSLTQDWQPLLAANPPVGVRTPHALLTYVKKLADRILLDDAFRKTLPHFKALFDALVAQDRAVASRGISVAGQSAGDVRILNNTIEGVLQGVHVGLSEHAARSQHELAQTVTIAGNTIGIVLPPDAGKRDRHGAFVGNCGSLLVENNNIRLARLNEADRMQIEGIRVWGVLGDRLMITQNLVSSVDGNPQRSFDTGINVNPLANARPKTAQWVVMWNVAPSKQTTVRAVNGAVALVGTNVP